MSGNKNRIGHYELLAELGSGAMGKVYRARDTRLDREVALKVLWPQLAEQPVAVARFEREARAVARLRHPNIVAIYDVGAVAGYYYLAMEYVPGCALRDLLQRPLPIDKTLCYFKQILASLGMAHEQRIIHRDLKPGNILIETATDTVKLADFGLARIVEGEVTLTRSSEILGTLEYLAPELGQGGSASRQSDLYAAGVVLYRMLTGCFPFAGATPLALLKAHKCGTYPLASKLVAGLPPQADGMLARLLACAPANRYADCQAVFADIERWERGEDIPLEFAAVYEPIDHDLGRHRVPGWKRAWTRLTSWYRYQWLEAFGRTELIALRIRDEIAAAEQETGKARRRLEEATLLQNRVRARADEARASMREWEKAAEEAHTANDEGQMRRHLAAKLEAKDRAEQLDNEAGESEQVVKLAQQEFKSREVLSVEMRHNADLLLARQRRAKMETSVLGVLPVGGRRMGKRLLAVLKLAAPVLLAVFGLYYLLRPAPAPVARVPVASQPTNRQVELPANDARWTRRKILHWPRAGVAAAVLEGKLLVFGGYCLSYQWGGNRGARDDARSLLADIEWYDPGTRRWQVDSDLLLEGNDCRVGALPVVVDGKLYFVGGSNAQGNRQNDIIEYVPGLSGEVAHRPERSRKLTRLTRERENFTVAAVNDDIYVIGGTCAGQANPTPGLVEAYTLSSGTWRIAAPLLIPRHEAAAVSLNGKIYVIGGKNSGTGYLDSVERYDPQADRWEMMAPLQQRRGGFTQGAVVFNGRIYVFGGWGESEKLLDTVERYEPDQNQWTVISRMPAPRAQLSAVTLGNEVFIVGGTDTAGVPTQTATSFRPE